MHVVFCIDDNPKFLRLLQVAVRSLRQVMGADIPCLCVYAGDNPQVFEALKRDKIPLANYKPILSREVIPSNLQFAIGCFLKLELALVPELLQDDYVLYCDVDVLFRKDITELLNEKPAYMAMAREFTAPFYHDHEQLRYTWRDNEYVVPMPFPIWTFSSGVLLYNLARLRKFDLIHNFLAFCMQNVKYIGNLDQSLLNYYFGKRISKLGELWNRPPYHANAYDDAKIVHFHGPKPWEVARPKWDDLRMACYEPLRLAWVDFLTPAEREEYDTWCADDIENAKIL